MLLDPYITDAVHVPGRFGGFGGAYVPQILARPLRELEAAFNACVDDEGFQAEFHKLLKDFAGRPTAFYECRNVEAAPGARLFLKREDLLHGGAHKTTQALGQALLAKAQSPRLLRRFLDAAQSAGIAVVACRATCSCLHLPFSPRAEFVCGLRCASTPSSVYGAELGTDPCRRSHHRWFVTGIACAEVDVAGIAACGECGALVLAHHVLCSCPHRPPQGA